MSIQSLALKSDSSQATPFLGTCKHCGNRELFLDQRGDHFGYFCRGCGRWQGKWIKHSEVKRLRQSQGFRSGTLTTPIYKPVAEQLRADFDSPRDNSHKSCSERFEKIEKELSGVNRQLLLFAKIILDQGILQGKQRPEFYIAGEVAGELGRKLYELEFENSDRPASDSY